MFILYSVVLPGRINYRGTSRHRLGGTGFRPLMEPFFTELSGIIFPRDRSSPTVNVIMTNDKWSSVIQDVVIGSYTHH
jgi:hypothetical protein